MKPTGFQIEISSETSDVSELLRTLGKEWALPVMLTLDTNGETNFNTLKRSLKGVSSRSLSRVLNDLAQRGLIVRSVTADIPPHVYYSLSKASYNIMPHLQGIADAVNQSLVKDDMKLESYLN
ncbi:helix-turn-helix transcriptional regulator [Thermoplasmatales archaeon AK]|nr:helix-turn-helix transcriptional regulator [Thermoplasmatales archaeon AK]